MQRIKDFWDSQEEWCSCSYYPVPYDCQCGFDNIYDADAYAEQQQLKKPLRTILIPTKKFYPNWMKTRDVKCKLNEFVHVEHKKVDIQK